MKPDRLARIGGPFGDHKLNIADFSQLQTACPFMALIPQWDYLALLAGEAQKLKTFSLLMETEAQELVSFEQVRTLSVAIDRLEEWSRPGLLMIGDAAHAMSPESILRTYAVKCRLMLCTKLNLFLDFRHGDGGGVWVLRPRLLVGGLL